MSSFCRRIRSRSRSRGPSYRGIELLRSTMVSAVEPNAVPERHSCSNSNHALFRPVQHLAGLAACLLVSVAEHFVNRIEVTHELRTSLAHCREIAPVVLE